MNKDCNESIDTALPLAQALKDARLSANLSIDEVAEYLNLSHTTVCDIENHLVEIIDTKKYPVIYLRGYLANYAKWVQLSHLEQYAEYQQLAAVQTHKKTLNNANMIIPHPKKRSKVLPLLLLLCVAIGGAFYFYQTQLLMVINQVMAISEDETLSSADTHVEVEIPMNKVVMEVANSQSALGQVNNNTLTGMKSVSSPDNTAATSSTSSAVQTSEVVSSATATELQNDTKLQINATIEDDTTPQEKIVSEVISNASGLQTNDALINVLTEQTSAAQPTETALLITPSNDQVSDEVLSDPVQTTQASLTLNFKADCWTEITDATGTRLAFGLYKRGRRLNLSGVAPFQLKLGDPSVVDIQYQDKMFEGGFTPGRSAQFSVPAS